MNIVFDNIIYSLQRAGGGSVVWQELTSRFISNGQDNLRFIEHPNDRNNIFRKLIDIPDNLILRVKPLLFILERYINPNIPSREPFIFHSSYFRTCRNKKAVNVVTIHDFTYDRYLKRDHLFSFLHIWQRNRAIKHSKAIICISENTKKDLLHFVPEVEEKKIHVIYNGVSLDYHIVKDKDASLSNYILFVGQRSSYKNGRWLVDSLSDSDYKLLFCGSSLSEDEMKCLNDTIGPDRYRVMTNISNQELNVVYNSVHCLVYPSSYEGFGIPVIEAQKAGCPVIALNASSIPEIIGETPLLMKELSKEELMSKLKLLEDKNIRENIVSEGLENAKRFSWDNTYNKYRQLYSTLID